MPYVEALLLALVRLWRMALLLVLAWVLLLVWLAARRSGRRGLALAIPMWALAALLFAIAVLAPRPALNERVAAGLVLLAAMLLMGSVAVLFLAARRPRVGPPRPPTIEHRGPPWDEGGW